MTRILLLDKDVRDATELGRMLGEHGAEVAIVHDGATGLARAASEPFDAVVVSVDLEGMSGLRVCSRIKKDPTLAGLRVVLVGTDVAAQFDSHRKLPTRADAYLQKPLRCDELLSLIERGGTSGHRSIARSRTPALAGLRKAIAERTATEAPAGATVKRGASAEELESMLVRAQADLARMKTELVVERSRSRAAQHLLEEHKLELSEEKRVARALGEERDAALQRLDALTKRLAGAEASLDEALTLLDERVRAEAEARAEAARARADLQSTLAALEAKSAEARTLASIQSGETAQAHAELEALKTRHAAELRAMEAALAGERSKLEAEREQVRRDGEAQLARIREEQATLAAELGRSRETAEVNTRKVEHLAEREAQLSAAREALELAVAERDRRIAELEEKAATAQRLLDTLEAARICTALEHRAELDELQRSLDAAHAQARAERQALESEHSERLARLETTFGEQERERALERERLSTTLRDRHAQALRRLRRRYQAALALARAEAQTDALARERDERVASAEEANRALERELAGLKAQAERDAFERGVVERELGRMREVAERSERLLADAHRRIEELTAALADRTASNVELEAAAAELRLAQEKNADQEASRLDALSQALAEARGEIAGLRAEVASAVRERERLEAELAERECGAIELERERDAALRASEEAAEALARMTRQAQLTGDELHSLRRRVEEAETGWRDATEAAKAAAERHDLELAQVARAHESALDELRSELAAASLAREAESAKHRETLEAERAEWKRAMVSVVGNATNLARKELRKELEAQLEAERKWELGCLRRELEDQHRRAREEWAHALAEAQEERERTRVQLEERVQELASELSRVRSRSADDGSPRDLEAEVTALRAEIVELEVEIGVLRNALSAARVQAGARDAGETERGGLTDRS